MIKSEQHSKGVIEVISRAKIYDATIGAYIEHFSDGRFLYTARLSNGRMEIPISLACDQEKKAADVSEERIQKAAESFQSNNPLHTNPNKEVGKKTQKNAITIKKAFQNLLRKK